MNRPKRLCLSISCLLLLGVGAKASAQAFFFNAGFDNSVPRVNVTDRADYPPICSGNRGLPGLDLVRSYFDIAHCSSNRSTSRLGETQIDVLFLIDDTRPLSQYMLDVLGEQNLLRTHRGRQVVDSGVRNFSQSGEHSNLNVLTVGEMDYRRAGNADAWWEKIVVAAGVNLSAEECDLSEQDQATISDFAQRTIDMNQNLRTAMLASLASFETNMSFDSTYSATARVGNALASEAIDQARSYIVGKIADQVPGFDLLVAFADAANDEIERAATAASSNRMGAWILQARTIFADCIGTVRCGANDSDEVQEIDLDFLRAEITNDICSLPENRRPEARQRLLDAANNLNTSRPTELALERGLFEAWINANYQSTTYNTDSAQGTIELIWEVDEDGDMLSFNGSTYVAKVVVDEYGDEAEDRMNTMISQLRSVSKPLDFKVKKRVCFIVDNVMPGGRSRECATLDEDNRVITRIGGSTNMAERAFSSDVWRRQTTRFIRRD